jgi:hypothetical protein
VLLVESFDFRPSNQYILVREISGLSVRQSPASNGVNTEAEENLLLGAAARQRLL